MEAKVDKIVSFFQKDSKTAAISREIDKNLNYVPNYYMNLESKSFERPSKYSGNLEKDLSALKLSVLKLAEKDASEFDRIYDIYSKK